MQLRPVRCLLKTIIVTFVLLFVSPQASAEGVDRQYGEGSGVPEKIQENLEAGVVGDVQSMMNNRESLSVPNPGVEARLSREAVPSAPDTCVRLLK